MAVEIWSFCCKKRRPFATTTKKTFANLQENHKEKRC